MLRLSPSPQRVYYQPPLPPASPAAGSQVASSGSQVASSGSGGPAATGWKKAPPPPSHTQLYVVSEVLKYDASGKATVSVVTANVSYAQTCSSPGGTYLFANLEIATTLATGKTRFRLVTSGNQGEWACKGEGRGDAIQMEVLVPRSITWRVQD